MLDKRYVDSIRPRNRSTKRGQSDLILPEPPSPPDMSPSGRRAAIRMFGAFAVLILTFAAWGLSTPSITQSQGINKYWVGTAGGNIHSADNWSDIEGSACEENGGAGVPEFDDVMVFTADCTNSTATATNAINVKGIEIRDGYTGTITVTTHSIGPLGFSQADGTFNAGTRFSVITGDFTLTGGTFNAASFRMTVNGAFDIQGGTFNHNNGSVDIVRGANSVLTALPPVFNDLHITDGLLGRWKLDEGTGDTAFDSSGMAAPKNGTLVEGSHEWVLDAPDLDFLNSSALQFNGVNGLIVHTTANTNRYSVNMGEMTVSAWVKRTDSSNSGMIVANDQSGTANMWLLRANGNGYQFRTRGCGTAPPTSCAQSSTNAENVQIQSEDHPINEWDHVVGVKRRDQMLLYVNGIEEATAVPPQYFHHPNTITCIGARQTNNCGDNPFIGLIADVRIYNRALSPTEVMNLANGAQYAAGSSPTVRQTLSANLDVAGNLSISHAILDTSSSNYGIELGGNFSNGGVLVPNGSTVTLNGGDQFVSGNTIFYNLTKTVTSTANLTFEAAKTQTIQNELTLQGVSGGALSLRSSVTGTRWQVNPQGTRTVDYLDVRDSYNTNGTAIATVGLSVVDAGNNKGWFNMPAQTPSSLGPTAVINGSTSTNGRLQFTFSLADPNGDDNVKFQIQTDDTDSFASPVIDYTSALSTQGGASFTVGQAANGGTYAAGAPNQTLSAGSYYWRVKAIDEYSEGSGYAVAAGGDVAFKIPGVTALPPAALTPPTAPLGGFAIKIDQGAPTAEDRIVDLSFSAGSEAAKIAISMTGDFTDAVQEAYQPQRQWDLCSKYGGTYSESACPAGTYTVWAKFFTAWGVASKVVSASILLNVSGSEPEALEEIATTREPGQPATSGQQGAAATNDQVLFIEPRPGIVPFARFLWYGMVDPEVNRLQVFLNRDPETLVSEVGPGSIGRETFFFGPKTRQAVIRFQEKYTDEVLAYWGLTRGTGFVGMTTTALLNKMLGF